MPLDPQCDALLNQMAEAGGPPPETVSVEDNRALIAGIAELSGPVEDLARVEDVAVPGPAGDIPVRVYVPEGDGPFPTLVFFHGGGWVIGNIDTHDVPVRRLANRVPAVVVSVDYRLAPEHPFPAAPEDCYAATAWAAANIGAVRRRRRRLAVGGDSAGGNLAAVVAQMARDRGGPAIAFQLLVYPAVDARMTHASITENGDGYLLTKGFMEWFYGHYLPNESDADDPAGVAAHGRRRWPGCRRRWCSRPSSTRCATRARPTPPRCAAAGVDGHGQALRRHDPRLLPARWRGRPHRRAHGRLRRRPCARRCA